MSVMSQAETWTVGRLLTWTTDYLKKSGSENPRLDAEVLLATARGCQRIALYTAYEEIVGDETRATFRELVKRRADGTPVPYLVGKKEFYSLSFRVSPDVLIPRPETEHLVVAALDLLGESSAGKLCVDVGTGSGAIAISVAKHATSCRVIATDISPPALELARQNAADHGLSSRIEFLAGDLLTPLPPQRQCDIIVSNPPYIGREESGTIAPAVLNHEPHLALFGGPTGTEIIARLIPQVAERLQPGGWLILEVSPLIATAVVELVSQDGHFHPAVILRDLAGLPRVVQAQRLA